MIRIEKTTAKAETKSTAARKDVPLATAEDGRHLISNEKCQDKREEASHRPAGTQALPLDTKPDVAQRIERVASNFEVSGSSPDVRANPPKQFSKTEYQQKYMADLRTIKRLGLEMTVAEWRKSNEGN